MSTTTGNIFKSRTRTTSSTPSIAPEPDQDRVDKILFAILSNPSNPIADTYAANNWAPLALMLAEKSCVPIR
jgi:hypothetical protein